MVDFLFPVHISGVKAMNAGRYEPTLDKPKTKKSKVMNRKDAKIAKEFLQKGQPQGDPRVEKIRQKYGGLDLLTF